MFGLVAAGVRRTSVAITGRSWVIGALFVVVGLFVIWFLALSVPADTFSTYRLSGGGDSVKLPSFDLPTLPTNLFFGLVILLTGIYQLLRGFARANLVLGVNFLLLVLAFLTWSIRGESLNLTGLLESTLLRATPFLFGALSGIMCERSGVINIAIEGMMLIAAFISVLVASITHNLWLGLAAGLASGGVIAAFHAVLSIQFKVDQIISGTVINIFAVGFTNFMVLKVLQANPDLNNSGTFDALLIPFLSDIPVIGRVFFSQNILVYAALILMFVVHFVLFYTRWGLRTRSVGEHPLAADTLGINVFRVRYINVIIGGVLAALGGCYLSLGSVGRFDRLMSGGRGFIALAAMIFGNWSPFGAFASSLIFGFADSLQVKLQILTSVIPSDFLLMAPYLATMIVLAGVVGRAIPPAADGKPYEKQ
jgi:simple sugar transport system permease protein